jgi:hypothetical protein
MRTGYRMTHREAVPGEWEFVRFELIAASLDSNQEQP